LTPTLFDLTTIINILNQEIKTQSGIQWHSQTELALIHALL